MDHGQRCKGVKAVQPNGQNRQSTAQRHGERFRSKVAFLKYLTGWCQRAAGSCVVHEALASAGVSLQDLKCSREVTCGGRHTAVLSQAYTSTASGASLALNSQLPHDRNLLATTLRHRGKLDLTCAAMRTRRNRRRSQWLHQC